MERRKVTVDGTNGGEEGVMADVTCTLTCYTACV